MSTNHPTNPPVRGLAMAATIRRRARAGLHPTNLPLGYRCDEGMVAVPDPAVAPLVREAILLMAGGEYSLRGLIAVMLAKGFRSKNGKIPSSASFRTIVTNPFYAGYILLDGSRYRGRHEAIVPEEVLDRVSKALSTRRTR